VILGTGTTDRVDIRNSTPTFKSSDVTRYWSCMQEASALSPVLGEFSWRGELYCPDSFLVSLENLQLFLPNDHLHRDMAKRSRAKLAQQYEEFCDQ
jgi:hypothetical protein